MPPRSSLVRRTKTARTNPYSSHHSLQNVRISCHCPQGLVHQDGSHGSPFAPIFLWASSILEHFNWHQNFWQSGAYLLVCICSDLKGKEKKGFTCPHQPLWEWGCLRRFSQQSCSSHRKGEWSHTLLFFITLLRTHMVSFMRLNLVNQKLILEANSSGNCALGLPTIPWWTNHQFISTKWNLCVTNNLAAPWLNHQPHNKIIFYMIKIA